MLVVFDVSETTETINQLINKNELPTFVQPAVLLDAVLYSLNSIQEFNAENNMNFELLRCFEFIDTNYCVEDFENQNFCGIKIDFELSNIFVSYLHEVYEKMQDLPFKLKPKQFQQLTDSTIYAIC